MPTPTRCRRQWRQQRYTHTCPSGRAVTSWVLCCSPSWASSRYLLKGQQTDGRAVTRRQSHQNHSGPRNSLWEALNGTHQSRKPGYNQASVPSFQNNCSAWSPDHPQERGRQATHLQMKPPLSHFLLASVFSGNSSSGLWRTSTSTDNSAWTRGLRRSSRADTMSWNGRTDSLSEQLSEQGPAGQ